MLLLLSMLACRPPAGVEVRAVEEWGPLPQADSIKGRDGGYSAEAFGETVWVYGDTVLSVEGEDGSSWRHNSWSHSADLDGSDGIDGFVEEEDALGAPRELFPQTDAEAAFNTAHAGDDCAWQPCGARLALWPGPVLTDPDSGRVWVGAIEIGSIPGDWTFWGNGAGLAPWSGLDARPERVEVRPDDDFPTTLWEPDEFEPNGGVVHDGAMWLFSCNLGWRKRCRLARAPLDDVLDRGAWRYWDGGDWAIDPGDAAPLFEGGSFLSVHWREQVGLWIAVYDRPFSSEVSLRTAPDLAGPWSEPLFVTDMPASWDGGAPYGALAHPELSWTDGESWWELVTWYRSPGDWRGELPVVAVQLAPAG
ncbi:MAG: DUF4185 domain-containing protein [Alphaproteobacteria bacterium]|nr:DUF4185 domain-containing protein [Alphaproteobacteria bacterium]